MKRIFKIILFLALISYLLYGLEIEKFLQYFMDFSLLGITSAIVITLICDVVVAYRWHLLSLSNVSIVHAFEAYTIASFVNNILPAKLGEAARVIYLKKVAKTSMHRSISLLFIERSADVLMLGSLAVCAFSLILEDQIYFFLSLSIVAAFWLVLVMIKYKLGFFTNSMRFIPMKWLRVYAKRVLRSISLVLSKNIIFKLIALTLLLWFLYYGLTYYFIVFVADVDLDIMQVVVVFVLAAVGMALPLAPGGLGAYHAGLVFGLIQFGLDKELAFAIAVVLHLIQIIPPIIMGGAIVSFKDLNLGMFVSKWHRL